ncbi:MAG TPA: ATP-binding protein, partial [Verrucomicrobiae bacterium]|nr:ATP-binding protein [Verrucomicrobiae bacterium]
RSLNVRQKGSQHRIDTHIIRKDGSIIPVDIAVSVLTSSDGTITGSIGIIKDISERVKLQKLKDDFVDIVTHELRTPVSIAKEGVAQLIEGLHGPVTVDQKEMLELVSRAMLRLLRIVSDLLDVSKIESRKTVLNKESVDVAELIKEVMATFRARAEKKNLKLLFGSGKTIEAMVDREKMVQVLTNLIGNAIKFTERGSVSIAVEIKEPYVQFSVEDTGPGIAAEDLPKLFSKFEQFGKKDGHAEKGSGLGLVISQGIIELHGGRIFAESQLGKGTRFTFTVLKD